MTPIANPVVNPRSSGTKYRSYIILFGLALLMRLGVALILTQPGYIDAYYYYGVAANFHNGHGLTSDTLWNYQLDRQTLPITTTLGLAHPAFSYWLPLASLLVIVSFALFGVSFLAAQLPFMLLAALLPPLAFWLGRLTFGSHQRHYSWAMAIVMLFPGRYFLFLNAPDNFAPFAVLILLGLICIYLGLWQQKNWAIVLVGLLSGLAYLSRSDGVLLLITLLLCFGWRHWQLRHSSPNSRPGWLWLVLAVVLAASVVTPWLWRNLNTFGSIMPGDNSRVLFMRDYQELFSYNLPLNFNYYVNQTLPSPTWGIGPLVATKLNAAWLDLLILAVQGLFLFGPLFLVGLFLLKKRVAPYSYGPFAVYLTLFYAAMVLVFTLVGEHGTLFHSAGGFLPFQAGAAVASLEAVVSWYGRRRKIKQKDLLNAGLGLFLALNIVLTLYVAYSEARKWDDDYQYGKEVGLWFKQHQLDKDVIIVSEPLSYYFATQQAALPLASNSVEANLDAAHRYGARWLALGQVHYSALDTLYEQKKWPGLVWQTTLDDGTEIFEIKQ